MGKKLVETLLRELVETPSITGDFAANDKILDMAAAFLGERGMHLFRAAYDGYGVLVATTRQTKSPAVMLVAHTDVVSASDKLFQIVERDGKLYGRGTRDMKGAIAAYMTAVDRLQNRLSEYDFGIMLISDEETNDKGIMHLLEEGYRPKSVVLLDGGESWQLEKLAKGALYIEVKTNGETAHGSRPWLGDSASFKLVEFLAEFKRDFAGHGPETDTLNISNMQSGTGAYNQLPDSATAMLDIRLISNSHKQPVLDRLEALCKKYDSAFRELVWFPVLEHDMNDPYLVSFADAITKVTGKTFPPTIAYGASDAVRFDALGIPSAVTYPLSGGHHSETEWIDRQALHDLVEVLVLHLEQTARRHDKITAEKLATA